MRFEEVRGSGVRTKRGTAVRAAVEMLRRGGLLAHPTATVYGLGGPADAETDAEIARLKGRTIGRPLLRLAADEAAARRLWPAARWDEAAARLAEALWPGPLTLVLDDGSESGFAVRVEAHPLMRGILAEWGRLMSSTSLNRTAEPPARDPEEARRILAAFPTSRRGALLLDAGGLPGPPPSTVVSLRGGAPRLLREGAVPSGRLQEVLGEGIVG
ncbi:MAG: L-threonylcarbamoyladenylate synthase [Gemmatimonadota bacterium]